MADIVLKLSEQRALFLLNVVRSDAAILAGRADVLRADINPNQPSHLAELFDAQAQELEAIAQQLRLALS